MGYKRKYPRIPLSGLALMKILETNAQISGPIELISRGGIGIYTKENIRKGARVSLRIYFDTGTSVHEYTLLGTVRTEEKQKEFGSVGIQFDREVNSTDHPQLYHFLLSKEKSAKEG